MASVDRFVASLCQQTVVMLLYYLSFSARKHKSPPQTKRNETKQVVIGMDVASSEFHTEDGMYDLDFKVCVYFVNVYVCSARSRGAATILRTRCEIACTFCFRGWEGVRFSLVSSCRVCYFRTLSCKMCVYFFCVRSCAPTSTENTQSFRGILLLRVSGPFVTNTHGFPLDAQ